MSRDCDGIGPWLSVEDGSCRGGSGNRGIYRTDDFVSERNVTPPMKVGDIYTDECGGFIVITGERDGALYPFVGICYNLEDGREGVANVYNDQEVRDGLLVPLHIT